MVHCISLGAGERLRRLAEHYELIWATGWEERANDVLPRILGLPELPVVNFGGAAQFGTAHWKLEALAEAAKAGRWPGSTTPSTRAATSGRARVSQPTLLVPTEPRLGLEEAHAEALSAWARGLERESRRSRRRDRRRGLD